MSAPTAASLHGSTIFTEPWRDAGDGVSTSAVSIANLGKEIVCKTLMCHQRSKLSFAQVGSNELTHKVGRIQSAGT